MLRRYSLAVLICGIFICRFSSVTEGANVGAHVKMILYDYKDGESNGVTGHEYAGMALSEMILYLSSEISETISVDLQPMFNTVTGATPRFGNKIGDNKYINIKPVFDEWRKAVLTVLLPYELEMAVGIVKPRFTWDYGTELFWEEEINGGKFSCNDFLGAMHETGIELYKPIEFSAVSLPTYLYLLNGGPGGQKNLFNDNNNTPTVMLHVEPEIGAFRFQGTLARGKWDDNNKYDMTRYSAGAAYMWGGFSARAEFAGGNWEKSIPTKVLEDATPFGYYAKLFYEFSSWGKAMLHYDYAKHNFNGFITTAPGEEEYITITPGLQITLAPGSMIQIQYDIADWKKWRKNQNDTLKFNRLTVGLRSTF
ncbi:MAG: hypothetical protein HOC71_03275 [Candidatus Latescibacteria bacterium]|jgi:hypothetical protein|nr:hypothetical protein [Desulfobacteraceae bacterium]MBT4482681.1 hypothetical protein [Candidatus Latescibacterota bacterium]